MTQRSLFRPDYATRSAPTDARDGTAASPSTTEPDRSGRKDLPLNVVFDILRNERRRTVLEYLLTESPTSTLGELAEHIAALENEKSIEALTSSERKRVYVCLYQCHLPKMDDAGVIDFEENRGTVEIGPTAEQLQPYVTSDDRADASPVSSRLYLGTVLGGGALFALQYLLVSSAWLSGLIVGTVVTAVGMAALRNYATGRSSDSA